MAKGYPFMDPTPETHRRLPDSGAGVFQDQRVDGAGHKFTDAIADMFLRHSPAFAVMQNIRDLFEMNEKKRFCLKDLNDAWSSVVP